jgi:hypothetical protein
MEPSQIDSVASTGLPGFTDLGISPQALEEVLQFACSFIARK